MATTVPPGRTGRRPGRRQPASRRRRSPRRSRRRAWRPRPAARRPRPGAGGGRPGRADPRVAQGRHRAQPDAAAADHEHPRPGLDRRRVHAVHGDRQRLDQAGIVEADTGRAAGRGSAVDQHLVGQAAVDRHAVGPRQERAAQVDLPARHRSHSRHGVCGWTATSVPSSSRPANSWPRVTGIGPHSIRCRSDPQIPADRTRTRTQIAGGLDLGDGRATSMPSSVLRTASHGPPRPNRVSWTVDFRSSGVTGSARSGSGSDPRAESQERPSVWHDRPMADRGVDGWDDSVQRWSVGDATITSVVEDETHHIPPEFFFPGVTAADAAAPAVAGARLRRRRRQHRPAGAGARDRGGGPTRAGRPVRRQRQGPPAAVLERHVVAVPRALRRRPASPPTPIDTVVHTHLHADHVGWDTHAGRRRVGADVHQRPPPLHRARAGLTAATAPTGAEDVYGDSVAPVVDAGLADIVAEDADLGDGLRLEPTTGHTPGPRVAVDRARRRAGARSPATSCTTRPSAPSPSGPRSAITTPTRPGHPPSDVRRAADSGALVVGTHFTTRPAGRIVVDGEAWRFEPGLTTTRSIPAAGRAPHPTGSADFVIGSSGRVTPTRPRRWGNMLGSSWWRVATPGRETDAWQSGALR